MVVLMPNNAVEAVIPNSEITRQGFLPYLSEAWNCQTYLQDLEKAMHTLPQKIMTHICVAENKLSMSPE